MAGRVRRRTGLDRSGWRAAGDGQPGRTGADGGPRETADRTGSDGGRRRRRTGPDRMADWTGSDGGLDRRWAMRLNFATRRTFCYTRCASSLANVFPGSSAVEQPAVNRLVAGSNPARGAKLNQVVRPRRRPAVSSEVRRSTLSQTLKGRIARAGGAGRRPGPREAGARAFSARPAGHGAAPAEERVSARPRREGRGIRLARLFGDSFH